MQSAIQILQFAHATAGNRPQEYLPNVNGPGCPGKRGLMKVMFMEIFPNNEMYSLVFTAYLRKWAFKGADPEFDQKIHMYMKYFL